MSALARGYSLLSHRMDHCTSEILAESDDTGSHVQIILLRIPDSKTLRTMVDVWHLYQTPNSCLFGCSVPVAVIAEYFDADAGSFFPKLMGSDSLTQCHKKIVEGGTNFLWNDASMS